MDHESYSRQPHNPAKGGCPHSSALEAKKMREKHALEESKYEAAEDMALTELISYGSSAPESIISPEYFKTR